MSITLSQEVPRVRRPGAADRLVVAVVAVTRTDADAMGAVAESVPETVAGTAVPVVGAVPDS